MSEMFNAFSYLVYSVNGNIFFRIEKRKLLKWFLLLSYHSLYFWNSKTEYDYNNYMLLHIGIRGYVLQTSQLMGIFIAYFRLMWNWIHAQELNQTLDKIFMLENIIERKYNRPKHVTQGIWFSLVVIFIILEYHFLNDSNIYWIFPVVKNTLENEFLIFVLRKTQNLFSVLNLQLLRYLRHSFNIQLFFLKQENGNINDIEEEDIEPKMSAIRDISVIHHQLVELAENLNSILAYNAFFFLLKSIIDFVHEFYTLFEILFYPERNYIAMMACVCWILYTSSVTCVIIYHWNSIAAEANTTSILLHDIWNVYANHRKVHKKLIHLQFISMRFLAAKLKFTALGFFPLDWTYIHKVVYTAATYIIILIQLQK